MYICCLFNFKRKTEAQAIFLNPFTVCSSCKRKFVVSPIVDEETLKKKLSSFFISIRNNLVERRGIVKHCYQSINNQKLIISPRSVQPPAWGYIPPR